ncbi:unnamed protein product [Dicrocoelium dendriticum]|nr:unnamed protein product [Dicrocoelium dendriticum]
MFEFSVQRTDKRVSNVHGHFHERDKIFNLLLQSGHSTQQSSTTGRPLSLLLRHNPVDFLNLLTLSISADAFFQDETFGFSHRSRLYRALISCSLELDATQLADSSVPSYPVHVFIFVIHQLALEADPKNVLDFALLFKLFSRICCEFKVYLRNNSLPFESAVTDLISRNRLTTLDDWLFLAQRAQCYHICEYIHRLRNETFEAFRDQLTALQYSLLPCPNSVTEATYTGGRADSESHPAGVRIFSFLEILFTAGEPKEDTLHSLHLTHEDVCNIKTLCLEKITLLARYDAERTLRLLSLMFDTPITNVLSRISTSFDRYKVGTTNGSTDQSNNLACLLLLRVYFQCRHRLISHADNSEASSPADTRDKSWESFLNNVSPDAAGFFVFLLVDSGASESELLQFLVTNHDYDAPSLFQTITPQAYPRALAFLYERLGDLDKALETHEQSFIRNWASLVHEYHASALGPAESTNSVQPTRLEPIQTALTETFQHQRTAVHSVADNWFSFCQRYQSLQKENAKNVWFRVIDLLMEEQSSVSESFLISELNEIFHDLLSFVTTSLSLTAIISYILQKQSSRGSTAKFTKQTSAFVTRLVTTCHFEAEQTALNRGLARHDLTLQQLGFLARFRRGCCAIQAWCDLCAHRLRYEAVSDTNCFENTRSSGHCVLLFRCGHVFHLACVYEDQKATAMDTQQSDLHLVCPMCLADTDVNAVHLTKPFGRSRRRAFVNHSDDPIRVEIVKRDVTVPRNPFDE